jgi:hypothetical protein
MATIQNDNDVLLQAAGGIGSIGRLLPAPVPSNFLVPNAQVVGLGALATQSVVTWSTQVTGTGKPADFADPTVSILQNSATAVLMSASALFKTTSGLGGVFLGSGGLIGKDSGGTTTFSIDGATGAATFKGTITGGANIDIAGTAKFGGALTASGTVGGGWTYGLTTNEGGSADGGGFGKGAQFGMVGVATGTNGRGLYGAGLGSQGVGAIGDATDGVASGAYAITTTKCGVWGVGGAASTGVVAQNTGGGTALAVKGAMTIDNSTLVANLNADLLDGLNSGNASGNIPISNGTLNTNLNSEKLGGHAGSEYVLYTGTVDVGSPGTAFTHALHCVLGATAFRIPVFIP